MPSTRLFSRTASRRIILLALTISLAALVVSLVATETGSACGGPPPKPLRALYTESDLVVVARVGQTVPVEVASFEDKAKAYLLKTSLHVNSTVKGQGNHGVISLYSVRWRGQNDDQAPTAYDDYDDGEKLLFFLKRRANEEGYEEADVSYGVKKLTDADLRVYVERMDELTLIMQQEKPDPARIVEWLVRCAEEPATRWEGLYELTMSKYATDAKEAEKNEAAAEKEDGEEGGEAAEGEAEADHASLNHGETAEAEGASDSETSSGSKFAASPSPGLAKMIDRPETYYAPDPELVGLLTAEQKKRLADVLFNNKPVTPDEVTLIELVKEWRDPRFAPFALAQLRSFGDEPPYMAETWMTALAESLGNDELMKLAAKYSEKNMYYDEDAEATAEAATEVDISSEEASAKEKAKEEEDPVEKLFEESLTGNSAHKRKLRLQRFLAHAEVALAN